MPHDPVRVADTRSWLVKAAHDLRAGETGLLVEPPLSDDVVFHARLPVEVLP